MPFDPPVTLPHDGNVHRSDNGPSLAIYHTNFGDVPQPETDDLLLSYNPQTQCTEACATGFCQACRHLVINFMDTPNPTTLSQPTAVEFSRIHDDTSKDHHDFAAAPAIAGLPDGVIAAWRQDRSRGGDDHDINAKRFSGEAMAGLLRAAAQVAATAGPGNH